MFEFLNFRKYPISYKENLSYLYFPYIDQLVEDMMKEGFQEDMTTG